MESQIQNKQDTEIKLDRKSKILFIILGLLIIGSIVATYWRYMVQRDYIIQSQIDCDPETQNCFIWQCDPMSLEEGEACTGVPDNDIWYYKNFSRNAMNIPDCDPKDENCAAYICEEGEKDCAEELCALENVPEGKECNDPEQYLLENPPEEEAQCEEGDEECLAEEESAECDPGDEECMSESEETTEECAPDDEECASQLDSEAGELSPASQDIPLDAAVPL